MVGDNQKEVAAALKAGAKKAGLLGEEKTAAALKGAEDSAVVVVFSTAEGIVEMARQMERTPTVIAPAPLGKVIAAPGACAATPCQTGRRPGAEAIFAG